MRKRILVVDDDMMNLKRTEIVLNKQYEVTLAKSGKEALGLLEKKKIDLVLLDVAMPEMDGIETFKRMKDRYDNIPVIFLTASGEVDDVVNAIKLGAVNYLKKPFVPRDLLDRVTKEFEKQ